MSVAALVAIPGSGDSAEPTTGGAGAGAMLFSEEKRERRGFEFALMPRDQTPVKNSSEASLDHLVEQLHRHAHDADALRHAAGAMRYTIETSLWQSASGDGGRLPAILASVLGRAAGLFIAGKLRWLAVTVREWLVLLSSPRRILWAVRAAWSGEDVAGYVREQAGWHSVDEIAVFQRDRETPIVRVGAAVPPDEDDWLASNPVFGVTKRHLSSTAATTDEQPVHAMVVIGLKSEITARITGHAPPGLREELQSLCDSADEILGDAAADRAERVFRLKQLVTPALKKTGPRIAGQFWNPLVILTVFLTAGAAILASAGVEHLRWEGVVGQLDSEPGIEVISHSAVWGRWKVEVLRDPQARPIDALLREMGRDPASVTVHERSFLSADEPLLAARQQSQQSFARQLTDEASVRGKPGPAPAVADAASDEMRDRVLADVRLDLLRTTLDLPGDLHLTLSHGDLTARGALIEPAFSRLAGASRKLGWLKKINLDQVRDVTGENIAGLVKGIEKTVIEFVPASAILPEASKLRLQSVASEMTMLATEARLKQQSVQVQFRASHAAMDDSTIRHRVDILRRDLERQGVPAAWFRPALDLLEAPGPHVIAFRLNLESPSPAP